MDALERLYVDAIVVLLMLGLAAVGAVDDAATWLGQRLDAALERLVGS